MTLLEEQTVQLLKAFFSPSGLLSRHEIDSMETALNALVEFQRATLELYYGKQFTFEGIAEKMELNPVTIRWIAQSRTCTDGKAVEGNWYARQARQTGFRG